MNKFETEISFSELRCKELVNARDGRKLGRIIDLIFSGETSKIKGIVAPFGKRSFFAKSQDVFIPWKCVQKIGEDVIIVDVNPDGSCEPPPPVVPECDGRCDKCGNHLCPKNRCNQRQ